VYYIYEHWRPDRDEPFYVGKGRGYRANLMARRNPHHTAIQKKLHRLGMAVEVRIIFSNLTEEEAYQIEIERIAMWQAAGIDLANKTIGGEGVPGLVFSKEHREKIGNTWRGKKRPPMSEEQKRKISLSKKGQKTRLGAKLSAETKEKIAASRRGKSSWAKGIPKSPEVREKISKAVSASIRGVNNPFWGKKHTEETRLKISIAKKEGV
jgi:hypothetical protein